MNALIGGFNRWIAASVARRQIAFNTGWLLLDKLMRALLGLIVGAWVARHLGPQQFGGLAYVLAFIAMFQAVANLGCDSIVVRDVAQEPDRAPEILGTTLYLRLGAGVLGWLLAVASVALLNTDSSDVILMTAIVGGTLVFQAADTVDLWFQSQSQSRLTVIAKLVAYIASAGIKVTLILVDAPLLAFACVLAIEGLMGALAIGFAYRRLPATRHWRFAASTARDLIVQAWPFLLSGVAIMVYMRIDQIMVKEILGGRALGIYAAAVPLSQFWQVIPLTLATSLAPFIARRRNLDFADYRQALVRIFRSFFYLGVLSAVATWLTADWLIGSLLGASYSEAGRVLKIHAISNVFCFLGVAHGLWLVNERRFAVRLYGTVLAGLTTVTTNWLLLPRFGVAGAAYGAVLSQFVAAVLINIFLDPAGFRMQVDAIIFKRL